MRRGATAVRGARNLLGPRLIVALLMMGCAAPAPPPASAAAPMPPAKPPAPAPPASSEPAPEQERESCQALASSAPVWAGDVLDAKVQAIERSDTLGPLFEALAQVERKKPREPVRIAIWGDSNLTLDEVSGALRRVLQRRFGDAGHGFIGFGNPRRGYRHMDVRRLMVGYWETYIYTRDAKPKRGGYGASGMAAATGEKGARIRIQTAEPGAPVGERASRFGVFSLQQPGGGDFAVEVDGVERLRKGTDAAAESVALDRLELEDAPHRFELVSLVPKRPVQLYGAFLERDVPGVVVDAFGVTGATYGTLSVVDPTSVRPMLEKRRHDLLVFALGTNFSDSDQNAIGLARLVKFHRSIDPTRPILVLAPPDHVKTARHMRSDPRIVRVVEQLRSAAASENVAFWDLREAMGGDGSMWLFGQRGLAGKDLYHFTSTGARIMGTRLAHALMLAHHGAVAKNPRLGCGKG